MFFHDVVFVSLLQLGLPCSDVCSVPMFTQRDVDAGEVAPSVEREGSRKVCFKTNDQFF